MFHNYDIYAIHISDTEDHHYEKPKEKKESHLEYKEPREKNMRVFYKLNIKENIDLRNTPHEEEYADENYESIEERETAV